MKWKETQVHIGGLLRCCLQSLGEFIDKHQEEEAVEGTIISCKYCGPDDDDGKPNENLIFHEGAWQWNQKPYDRNEAISTMGERRKIATNA